MPRSSTRRLSLSIAFAATFPLVVLGCPNKKQESVPEAGSPPPPPPVQSVELTRDEPDAGPDADAEAGKRGTGVTVNPNTAKIRACCNAIRAQAKQLGASQEALTLTGIAAQCDVIANQVGPTGNAPEFAAIRQMLAGKSIPGGCGF